MISFVTNRLILMFSLLLCVTALVFVLTNLPPSLEKLARSEGNSRMTDDEVVSWLRERGYERPMILRYGEWLGVVPGFSTTIGEGELYTRCIKNDGTPDTERKYCGVLQGYWGISTTFNDRVSTIVMDRLTLTGKLMFFVVLLMVPTALLMGVVAGMREGSKTDRTLSSFAITTAATPEYVSGVILVAVFVSSAVGLRWFKGTATSAMEDANFQNFFLPVLTISLYGIGYIARMTRASMAEVMTTQYIRTARLKGLSFSRVVLRHALRNALIAPFTVILLQIPWLLTGVVVVETLFNYKGFGWVLVMAAGNNDIELLLGVSVVSVLVVLVTQLLSDIGYVYLNPRIRLS